MFSFRVAIATRTIHGVGSFEQLSMGTTQGSFLRSLELFHHVVKVETDNGLYGWVDRRNTDYRHPIITNLFVWFVN